MISTKAENGKERWFVVAQLPFYLHETLEMKHQLDLLTNELQSSPRVSLLDMRPRNSEGYQTCPDNSDIPTPGGAVY